jgi:hypothetical protein
MSLSKTKVLPSILCLFIAALFLLGGNRIARADYYRYTDSTGAVCMTNTLDSVPRKYRASMKVIREEALDRKDQANRGLLPHAAPALSPAPQEAVTTPQENGSAAPGEKASVLSRLTGGAPWKKALLIVGVIVVLFVIVKKLTDLLPSAQLARVICIAFFLGTFVFLYKAYAEHLTNSFTTIKSRMIAMFEKSNRREAPEHQEKRDPMEKSAPQEKQLQDR